MAEDKRDYYQVLEIPATQWDDIRSAYRVGAQVIRMSREGCENSLQGLMSLSGLE